MQLTWNEVTNATIDQPLSNRGILASLGIEATKHAYQDVAALTRIMARAGELYVTPDPQARKGLLFQRAALAVNSCRTDEQVASDTLTGADNKKAAERRSMDEWSTEMDLIRSLADRMIIKHGKCNTDLLRDRVNFIIPAWCWGMVFLPKKYTCVGRVRSSIKSNNSRMINEWAFSD